MKRIFYMLSVVLFAVIIFFNAVIVFAVKKSIYVDMETISETGVEGEDYSKVKFGTGSAGTDYYWAKFEQESGFPNFVRLGTFDLANINAVRFDMVSAAESTFSEESFLVFSKDPEGKEVLLKVLAEPGIGWATPLEVYKDNFESDYNGPVYLSFIFSGSIDGLLVGNIEFIAEVDDTYSPEKTEGLTTLGKPTASPKPVTTPDLEKTPAAAVEEGCVNSMVIVAIIGGAVVVSGAVILVIKKKKA